MNLHGIVAGAIGTINPNRQITWLQSNGYATGAGGRRTPVFTTSTVKAQIQAVSAKDLQHLDGLNIAGVMRSVWLFGDVQSIVRQTSQGGDILQFAERFGGDVVNWLVATVIETWFGGDGTNGWCHVIAVLQVTP